jgi:hypothetical protein
LIDPTASDNNAPAVQDLDLANESLGQKAIALAPNA